MSTSCDLCRIKRRSNRE